MLEKDRMRGADCREEREGKEVQVEVTHGVKSMRTTAKGDRRPISTVQRECMFLRAVEDMNLVKVGKYAV